MKKLAVLLVVLIAAMVAMPSYAVEINAGIATDFVIDRDINDKNSDVTGSYESQNYDAVIDIKLNDMIKISPKIGLTNNTVGAEEAGAAVEFDNKVGLNLGIDGDVCIYKGLIDADIIGGYRWTRSEIDSVNIAGISFKDLDYTTNIHEWEIGGKIAKDINIKGIALKPYIGLVYSDLNGEIENDHNEIEIEADDNLGLRLGVSGVIAKNLSLAIDGKLLDQKAITAKLTYKF